MEHQDRNCSATTPEGVEDFIVENGIQLIDATFVDPLGTWHHCTFAPTQFKASDIRKGFGIDGSSIRLFCTVECSDMIIVPDPNTCWVDPFQEAKVLHVTCDVIQPNGDRFDRCPRTIAQRAVEYMKSTGIAEDAYFGPEAEFFIFDEVRYTSTTNCSSFFVDGGEAYWNEDRAYDGAANLGHRNPKKRSYFPVAPNDSNIKLRNDMLLTLGSVGVPIEKHHHEVASCQHELGYEAQTLVRCADSMMTYKYVVKNTARKHGKTATFMPKPLLEEMGSGMHCHQSLWKNNTNLFWDDEGKYQNLSSTASHYIAGIIKHAPAILAFSNPTVNSYKRLVPGYEAPVNLMFSRGNRSAAIRIPLADAKNPKAKRIEFRCPDAASCPYIAFSAMLLGGLDGIANKMTPPEPLDCDVAHLTEEQKKTIMSTPANLNEALDALENDHEFLTFHGVFPESFVKDYIKFKRLEARDLSLIPHPKEYELYFSV